MVAALLWVAVLAGLTLAPKGERRRGFLELGAASFGVLAALTLTNHWWSLRYVCLALIPAARGVGFMAERLASRWQSQAPVGLVALAILVVVQGPAIAGAARWARPDWRLPADYLAFMDRQKGTAPILAADGWAFFAVRAQLAREHREGQVTLHLTGADLSAGMSAAGKGWVIRAPRFGVPPETTELLRRAAPWARFPEAEECALYRFESGRLVSP